MNTAKHAQFTPGPCTCEIIMRTGETLDSSLGDRLCSDISRIQLCPMHAAAPAMYEAIKQVIEHRKREFLDNSIEPYCSLVAALAKADCEGRP